MVGERGGRGGAGAEGSGKGCRSVGRARGRRSRFYKRRSVGAAEKVVGGGGRHFGMSSSRQTRDATVVLAPAGSPLPGHLQYLTDATEALVDFTWERLAAKRVRAPAHPVWMRAHRVMRVAVLRKEKRFRARRHCDASFSFFVFFVVFWRRRRSDVKVLARRALFARPKPHSQLHSSHPLLLLLLLPSTPLSSLSRNKRPNKRETNVTNETNTRSATPDRLSSKRCSPS